jgi:hypothetical protein
VSAMESSSIRRMSDAEALMSIYSLAGVLRGKVGRPPA